MHNVIQKQISGLFLSIGSVLAFEQMGSDLRKSSNIQTTEYRRHNISQLNRNHLMLPAFGADAIQPQVSCTRNACTNTITPMSQVKRPLILSREHA